MLVPPNVAESYRPEFVFAERADRPELRHHDRLPRYSSNIGAAWQVAELLRGWSTLVIQGGSKWYLACGGWEEIGASFPVVLCRLAKAIGEASPEFLEWAQQHGTPT